MWDTGRTTPGSGLGQIQIQLDFGYWTQHDLDLVGYGHPFATQQIYNAVAIHSTIMDCLYEWDLSNKAFAFTLDNATSNNGAVRRLRESLWTHMPFDGDDLHVRCLAHILNLVVQDGMETIRSVVEPVRDVIKHISSSSSRLQIFNTIPQ